MANSVEGSGTVVGLMRFPEPGEKIHVAGAGMGMRGGPRQDRVVWSGGGIPATLLVVERHRAAQRAHRQLVLPTRPLTGDLVRRLLSERDPIREVAGTRKLSSIAGQRVGVPQFLRDNRICPGVNAPGFILGEHRVSHNVEI